MIVVRIDGQPEKLYPGSFLIGRLGRGADLEIDDKHVSPAHALVFCDADGAWWVEDRGSTNGTWLGYRCDIRAIGRIPVTRGMRLRVGRTMITLVPV